MEYSGTNRIPSFLIAPPTERRIEVIPGTLPGRPAPTLKVIGKTIIVIEVERLGASIVTRDGKHLWRVCEAR